MSPEEFLVPRGPGDPDCYLPYLLNTADSLPRNDQFLDGGAMQVIARPLARF
ncbi:MAG: hypothetical protein JW862_10295 [Anaerolineales bacterium]|nr:hypothetical protein [Anaerolineales bacterium]